MSEHSDLPEADKAANGVPELPIKYITRASKTEFFVGLADSGESEDNWHDSPDGIFEVSSGGQG